VSTQTAIDLYDSSIAYVDLEISRLLKALEDAGVARRTLVVFTSDHGEHFGEHGLAGHGTLFDPVLRAPLLIASPSGLGAGQRRKHQVRSRRRCSTMPESPLRN
jgi:arylsulfatase A-like enzyme